MRYWVVDSETTGLDDEAKAVEVAGFYCVDGEIIKHYSSLVNPGIPIPAAASAVHHITDSDVANAPSIEEAMMPFFDEEFEFAIAHQSKFDMRFMDFGSCPWLCTWKLALRIYPDAPSYGNQVLRYYLNLPSPVVAKKEFAHRALYDSEVTTHLFHDILKKAKHEDPWPGMQKVSESPGLLKTCYLSKHKNTPWKEVPRDYLNWIVNPRKPHPQPFDEDILYTAKYYLER